MNKKITIGVLGGHSALDVCQGATKLGFDTVVVCQKGREKTYEKYFKRRMRNGEEVGCVGNIIVVDKFGDVVKESVQKELEELNTVFVHNRYFWVYCDFEKIEKDFRIPIYGLRKGVKLEERDVENNQYELLKKAGIRIPKIVREGGKAMSKEELTKVLSVHFDDEKGGPLLVKANEAERTYERAFFTVNSVDHYFDEVETRVNSGQITQENADNAVIEEYVIGAHINLNFFYSVVHGELELMGTDTRRQTSLDGFLRLNAVDQTNLLNAGYSPSMIETGHYGVTMKESLVEKAFDVGEKFIKTMKEEVSPGMIGPFALQGAVAAYNGKEEFVIFDVSMRIPGSPGTKFTPYSGYLYGESVSYGERIALELKEAIEEDRLDELLT